MQSSTAPQPPSPPSSPATLRFHPPVLVREVLDHLQAGPGGFVWADCTAGTCGHALAIAEAIKGDGTMLLVERDPKIAEIGRERFAAEAARRWPGLKWHLRIGSYCELPAMLKELGLAAPRGILVDAGANYLQLTGAGGAGGMSFSQPEAPLDGRFNPLEGGPSIADLVNTMSEQDIADTLWRYGEERRSRTIARRIVEARRRKPLERVGELAEAIRSAFAPRERHATPDCATRSWQALRICANDELAHLESGLRGMIESLGIPARLVVLSFQSGEARIIKRLFEEYGGRLTDPSNPFTLHPDSPRRWRIVTKRAVRAGDEEQQENPGSRPAQLRCIERTG